MAYYTGTMTKTIGALLTILDAKLPLNSNWSIHDPAAATNCKVYKNYNASLNSLFYVRVNDNQTDWATIQLWEGWNEVTHVGVGVSIQTINSYEIRIYKENGGYGLCLGDLRFIFLDLVADKTNYIGQLKRFNTSKNMPSYFGTLTDNNYTALGWYNNGTQAGWSCLFDEGGTTRLLQPFSYGVWNAYRYAKTIAGTVLVYEMPIVNVTTLLIIGLLDGVSNYYPGGSAQLISGDVITLAGVDWRVFKKGDATGSSGCCAVRQD